jgi:tripartite-type tricarboxylate transporter receptor subunit TctC
MPTSALAQSPHKIELIVPFPAGGGTDLMARALSEGMSTELGHTIVIVNRDGAGGTIGATAVALAEPDGSTLGFSAMGVITGRPHLRSDLRYNVKSFDYICQVSTTATVIVVANDSPYRSLKDVFEKAKLSPEKLTYGHPGQGSIPHLQMIDLSTRAGATLTSVPFRGEAPARTALLGKHIDILMSGDGGAIADMRPLAIIAPKRTAGMADVPTTSELGFGEGFGTPFGLFAPKGVPQETLARMRKACASAVQSAGFRETMSKAGQTVDYLDGSDFAAQMEQVSRVIGELVEKMPALKN